MNDMIERVARAIARGRHGLGDSDKENALAVDYHWRKYSADARAAIEAMREPTKAMRDAYNDSDIVGYGPDGSDHDLVWKAGIDAALKD